MQMHTFSVCFVRPPQHPPCPQLLLLFPLAASSSASSIIHPSFSSLPTTRIINSRSIITRKPTTPSSQPFHANSPKIDSTTLFGDNDDASEDADAGVGGDNNTEDDDSDLSGGMELLSVYRSSGNDDIKTEIEEIGKNSRRIRSRIAIEASLQTVWNILTDYEKLADFIPGLAVSQLLERRDNFVRLFQIGQQKLAFGLSFNAKGIIDCYEKQLENLPFGQKRNIEFKMIEGDFKLFEGKWSIEQYNTERCEDGDSLMGQESHTTLSYVVDVEPKLWLPVRLVEGRLCREITLNLSCIRVEAQKGTTATFICVGHKSDMNSFKHAPDSCRWLVDSFSQSLFGHINDVLHQTVSEYLEESSRRSQRSRRVQEVHLEFRAPQSPRPVNGSSSSSVRTKRLTSSFRDSSI